MMGVAASDYDTVFNASNVILSSGDPEYVPEGADPMVAFMTAAQQLNLLMVDLATYRREHPTDDVTSALVNTNVDGENAHGHRGGLLLHPAGRGRQRDHPQRHQPRAAGPDRAPGPACAVAGRSGGIAATGVDEIVRWGSPVIWMRRTVADRRPCWARPSCTRATRSSCSTTRPTGTRTSSTTPSPSTCGATPNPHIGFGAAGPHFCLGAHLARQEIDVMFRRLFERLPDIESVGEPDRLLSPFINGIKHLDCPSRPSPATR